MVPPAPISADFWSADRIRALSTLACISLLLHMRAPKQTFHDNFAEQMPSEKLSKYIQTAALAYAREPNFLLCMLL